MDDSNPYRLNQKLLGEIDRILASQGVSPTVAKQPHLLAQSLEVRAATALSNGECFVFLFLPAERTSIRLLKDTNGINDIIIRAKSLKELAETYEVFLQENKMAYHRDPQVSLPELLRGATTATYRLVRCMEDKDGQMARAQAIEALCDLAQCYQKGQP